MSHFHCKFLTTAFNPNGIVLFFYGILAICFVLSANLCVLSAFPLHQCKMKEMLRHLEHEIKKLNTSLKVDHIHYNPANIHQPVINTSMPIAKQNKSATCGLVYMEKALELIRDHQRNLIKDEDMEILFKEIITRLHRDIIPCANHNLAKCDNPHHPVFPGSHFKAKQWTRNFLEASVKFLHQIIHLLERPKRHE
ncbi:hypothetical protein HF521_014464 [Silurus meridionalis]|uniref:Uncharacterized protein n=1 Tax=Silurus meridionalis TaxID=175797 RepID=A0A8T0A8F6_SILME|nr:hypothetical protein HF521_014464 [Silurus meridionalis]